eukprot:g6414.t1
MSTRNRHIIRVDSSRKPKYVKRRIGKKEKRILKLLASRRRGEETSKTSKLKELTLFSKFRKIKQMDMFGSDVRRHHRITNERSKVEELVVAENVVLALTRTGLCVAFDRDTKKLLTTLNASDHSLVRSIFHNRSLSSVIIVSVSEHDNFAALNCEEIKLEDIRSQNVREDTTSIVARLRLFTKETLRWPAFVEFDDANEKILTFSSSECKYKIWSMQDYETMFEISGDRVEEIKISPGILLIIFACADERNMCVPLQLRCINTGRTVVSFEYHLAETDGRIEFIEQFKEKLIVKQYNGPLKIFDISKRDDTHDPIIEPASDFVTPRAFIYLYLNEVFLTFTGCEVSGWNFRGQRTVQFEDHELCDFDDCNTNSVGGTIGSSGSIHFSNILTGECIARIEPDICDPDTTHALTDITVLFYCEETNEIYTGNRSGFINVWSN